jgi:hypothetical protein
MEVNGKAPSGLANVKVGLEDKKLIKKLPDWQLVE